MSLLSSKKFSWKMLIASSLTAGFILFTGCTDTSKDADTTMEEMEKTAMNDGSAVQYDLTDAADTVADDATDSDKKSDDADAKPEADEASDDDAEKADDNADASQATDSGDTSKPADDASDDDDDDDDDDEEATA